LQAEDGSRIRNVSRIQTKRELCKYCLYSRTGNRFSSSSVQFGFHHQDRPAIVAFPNTGVFRGIVRETVGRLMVCGRLKLKGQCCAYRATVSPWGRFSLSCFAHYNKMSDAAEVATGGGRWGRWQDGASVSSHVPVETAKQTEPSHKIPPDT